MERRDGLLVFEAIIVRRTAGREVRGGCAIIGVALTCG
jgi:hypothetical protein